jgi:hypothetical protein
MLLCGEGHIDEDVDEGVGWGSYMMASGQGNPVPCLGLSLPHIHQICGAQIASRGASPGAHRLPCLGGNIPICSDLL